MHELSIAMSIVEDGGARGRTPRCPRRCCLSEAGCLVGGRQSRCIGDPVMIPEPRLVELRKNVLKANDVVARALRERFRSAGVLVVTLVSRPGTVWTPFSNSSL